MHPKVKPIALVAAERVGRRARLTELESCYVDASIRRWQAMTGQQAINAVTRITFDAMANEVANG